LQTRRTRISIPESKTEDHDIDTLDLGDYAQVGLLATDNQGNPTTGRRNLYLRVIHQYIMDAGTSTSR